MQSLFQLASGTVPGRDHVVAGKNSHDAFHVLTAEDLTVAVVCDGCGSGAHSEVGAKLGAAFIAQAAVFHHRQRMRARDYAPAWTIPGDPDFWEMVRADTLSRLKGVLEGIDGSRSKAVTEYFLFTAIVALIADDFTDFVAVGDGVCIVNGERLALGPFAGNAPPYISYDLLPTERHGLTPEDLRFTILRTLPTSGLQSFLIGTDGVEDLISAAERPFPGTEESVGPIENLWTMDRFHKNPDMLRRHLARANLPRPKGLLPDDTTIVVGRRRAVP